MSEEEVKKLLSDIECDFWNLKNNIAYINKKQYHGLSRDLLDYIRDLEKRINKAVEYIENNSLYDEEYDYNYEEEMYLSGIDDEVAKKDLLSLLKGDKE